MAFLFFQTSIFALSIPQQDESIYVNDYSNVISEETKNELVSINQSSDYETGGYVVVATFDFVDEDLYDFSYRLFNEWKIGSSEYNNGILLVLDIGNDNYCYILGTGIESILTDSEARDIIDTYMEPDFAAKDYDQAVLKTTKQFLSVIENANYVIDDGNSGYPEENEEHSGLGVITGTLGIFSILAFGVRIIVPLLFIIALIVILSSIFRPRRGGYYHRPMFGPTYHRHRDPFAPRPNRNFNDRSRHSSFGGGRSSGFGGSRSSSSFGGTRSSGSRGSHHSGGGSRGAGGTRH